MTTGTKNRFEEKHGVLLLAHDKSAVRWLLRWFVSGDRWMTHRLPFQRRVRITHPAGLKHPELHNSTLDHELHHVAQFRPWYGPFTTLALVSLFPLPIYFSGRWFIERGAYLSSIHHGEMTLDQAVDILWTQYLKPWPKSRMYRWFNDRLNALRASDPGK